MNELCLRSAVDLAGLLARREASCVDVMDAHLAQIAEFDPRLNAIVTLDVDRAHDISAGYDANYSRDSLPPLWGLPTAHKDLVSTRGMRTTFGSTLFAGPARLSRTQDKQMIAVGTEARA